MHAKSYLQHVSDNSNRPQVTRRVVFLWTEHLGGWQTSTHS